MRMDLTQDLGEADFAKVVCRDREYRGELALIGYDTSMPFIVEDAFLPATLTSRPMTDEQFAAFCAEHPDLSFESTATGEIIVMPPNFSKTGAQNLEILYATRDLGAERWPGNRERLLHRLCASEWSETITRCVLDS